MYSYDENEILDDNEIIDENEILEENDFFDEIDTSNKNELLEDPDFENNNISMKKIGADITIESNVMQIYKPKITRSIMSIYEFVGTITKLADYLYHLDDLSNIIENENIDSYINHLELAWKLLKNKKYNATLNRYVENVSFSELDINPRWIEVIEHNFELHNNAFEEDVIKALGL
jgi:hypothetical protein